MHGVKQLLLLPAALGIATDGHYLSYQVAEEEAAAARAALQRSLPQRPTPLVGLQIESFPTKPYRNWPVEHFLDLCERLLAEYPKAHFLLLGGKLPRERTDLFRRRLGDRVTVFAGKLTLRQSGAMMSLLDIYVGVDTGPTHLAGALGIPMVAMYHCLHPSKGLMPLEHSNLHVLDLPPSDAGCGPHSNLGDIPVEVVLESVRAALSEEKTP